MCVHVCVCVGGEGGGGGEGGKTLTIQIEKEWNGMPFGCYYFSREGAIIFQRGQVPLQGTSVS